MDLQVNVKFGEWNLIELVLYGVNALVGLNVILQLYINCDESYDSEVKLILVFVNENWN